MKNTIRTVIAIVMGSAWVGSGAWAQDAISISVTDDERALFDPTELAGAPGVRVGNWNSIQEKDSVTGPVFDGILGDNETILYDDGSTVGGGFTVTPSDWNFGNRGSNPGTNDPKLFNGIKDIFGGAFSIAVSNVPYAVYDVYVYMRDDRSGRAGSFNIGATTYYMRGFGDSEGDDDPTSDGSGYVLSTDTTLDPATGIDQGNYVRFADLTATNFTLSMEAINAGNLDRNKFAGFQIVQPPEGTVTNIALDVPVPELLAGNPSSHALTVFADLDTGDRVTVTLEQETSYTSSDTNVLSIAPNGRIEPEVAGVSDLVVSYQGLSLTQAVTVLGPQSVVLSLTPSNLFVGATGGADPAAQASLLATFAGVVDPVEVAGFDFVVFSGAPTSVVDVTTGGAVTAVGEGAFSLMSTYAGVSDSLTEAGTVAVFTPPILSGGRAAIGLNIALANSPMTFRDLSGASGARTANWNNMVVGGGTGSISNLTDSGGSVLTGTTASLQVTAAGGNSRHRGPTATTNESVMISSIVDLTNNSEGTATPSTLTVTEIPFAEYDLYCYIWNDEASPTRVGYFEVNGVTNWVRNLDIVAFPGNDGAGYVEARTEGPAAVVADVPQGNYVKFTSVRGSTLTMTFAPASTNLISDADSGAPRLKMSAFQIVQADVGPAVSGIEIDGANVVVRWESMESGNYTVSTAGQLEPSDWIVTASNLPATPPENAYTNVGAAAEQGYVRVEREIPPPLLDTDFESGPDGWTSPATGGTQWELGDPNGFGPGAAHSGTTCWGTSLSLNYTDNADTTLVSPLVDLTGISSATLTYWQFHDIEPPQGGQVFDKGEVRVVDSQSNVLAVLQTDIAGNSAAWQEVYLSLPQSVLDQEVRFEFQLTSDELFSSYAGWYVDDIAITSP